MNAQVYEAIFSNKTRSLVVAVSLSQAYLIASRFASAMQTHLAQLTTIGTADPATNALFAESERSHRLSPPSLN